MVDRLATVALAPVLVLQGRRLRRLPRLPEASGARTGVTGSGPALRLLIAGDSAAAGVGAPTLDQALAGQLVAGLSPHYRVHWRVEAKTGATTAGATRWLRRLQPTRFDVLVTSLGVNDLTRGVPTDAWLAQQDTLRELVRERFGVRHFVVSGLPPVGGFPALPQPLRWYLGRRADDYDRHLAAHVADRTDTRFVTLRFSDDASQMADDGFHPGPAIYAGWGARAAALVRELRGA